METVRSARGSGRDQSPQCSAGLTSRSQCTGVQLRRLVGEGVERGVDPDQSRSSTASRVIDAVTRWPPSRSTLTTAITVPRSIDAIVPVSWLRVERRMVIS